MVITCLTSRPNGSIPVTKGSFKFTVAALAGRFRVVAVDFPGFGDSDKPIGAVYDALSFADAMLDLLDALELDRADLIGNSLGGRFALELALLRYSRFRRALKTGNMAIIRSAAGELPHVDLVDALAVCVAIRRAEPDRFERAALRWLARFCVERREVTLAEVQRAAWAFENITDEPAALETRQRLCSR